MTQESMSMKKWTYHGIAAIGLLMTFNLSAKDCAQAEQWYQQALSAGQAQDFQTATKWLQQSTGECDRYENWVLLGQANLELGDYDEAETALAQAENYVDRSNTAALANLLALQSRVSAAQGKNAEALALAQTARRIYQPAPAWLDEWAQQLDAQASQQPLTVSGLERSLDSAERAVRLIRVEPRNNNASTMASTPGATSNDPLPLSPSVNIRINFDYDSTQVAGTSRQNVSVLAETLAKPKYQGKRIILVGHTDKRGDAQYNMNLSLKRAAAIQQQLIGLSPQLQGHIQIQGKGEDQLLYQGDSEQVHLLNRRIEVFLL